MPPRIVRWAPSSRRTCGLRRLTPFRGDRPLCRGPHTTT
jgi:hypothetical protein